MLVNYVGPQDPDPGISRGQSFKTHQFESVALGENDPKLYKNKIVLVIPAASVTKDFFNTPFGEMYGGYVQTSILNTILNRNPITPAGDTWNKAILLLVGLATTIFASRFGIWRSSGTVLLLAGGYVLLTLALFGTAHLWINVVTPELTIVLTFTTVMALRFATEERQRRRTTKIFGQYIKPEIVDLLLSAPKSEIALAGTRREVSVLFVDIRGFTSLSERMEPEDVLAMLDVYLKELTECVFQYDGTLAKYVGDELMAIWNAPRYLEDHPLRAAKSALAMVSRMESINEQLQARGLPAVAYGVGVNSGEAIVGQMGSPFRKQYDVIGDTVNTAARLCGAARGGEIIVGERCWQMIGNQLVVEETEPLKLKGKSQTRTFKVLGVQREQDVVPDVALVVEATA
jgi:adenylate cyclase